MQYLKKGTQVYVEGTPDIRTYTTNDGRQGASLSLRVSSVQLLGGKTDVQQPAVNAPIQQQSQPQNISSDYTEPLDDLPF